MGKIKKEKNSKNIEEKEREFGFVKKKKNCDKRKSSPEVNTRKYGYISADSVIAMAESAGFSGIQEDVARNLAEDVTYRLRYIIQQCKKYMIHSRRKKLSSSDISEVLKMCDAPALYGYAVDEPLYSFTYIREADVFVLDDSYIDLPTFALSEVMVHQKSSPIAAGKWLKCEDNKNEEIKSESPEYNDSSENSKHSIKASTQYDNQKGGNETDESETKIPTNLIKYYGVTCNTILGHSDLKIIFQNLSNSCKIVPIIPYLLNFITIALNKLSNERQVKRLLQAVEALTNNKNIDFSPYSATTRVVNAMLLIVAVDKKPAKVTSDYHLRYYASRVLSSVLHQWCTRDEQKASIIKKMGKLISDFKMSPRVHYGAIALLTALGSDALNTSFWTVSKEYLGHLEELKRNSMHTTCGDVAMLEEIILIAATSLYRTSDTAVSTFLTEADESLRLYFGDSLGSIIPSISFYPRDLGCSNTIFNHGAETTHIHSYSKTLKYMNSRYEPKEKNLTVENVFTLPKMRKKKNTRIIFKFAGAIPVAEVDLKRRRMDSRYSQFIAGKESEGHVVVAGKFRRIRRYVRRLITDLPVGCLCSVL